MTLQPMTETEYDAYMPTLLEDYAAERAQADDTPLEEERKTTMRALEEELRPAGVTHIGLSVFGQNSVARALYDKLGYRVAATFMLKRIGDAG